MEGAIASKSLRSFVELATEYAKSGDHNNGISAIARMEEASLLVLSNLEELARAGENDSDILCASDH